MIRLILLTDYTESFSYGLLKGILTYSRSGMGKPWVVCRMPHTYKQTHGMEGVLRWAKVALEAGLHEVVIRYFEDYMGQALEVGYSSRCQSEVPLPASVLFVP